LHNEVPGMKIPESLQRRIKHSEKPALEGIKIAVEFLNELVKIKSDKVAGVYLMPPFEKYDMAIDIISQIKFN